MSPPIIGSWPKQKNNQEPNLLMVLTKRISKSLFCSQSNQNTIGLDVGRMQEAAKCRHYFLSSNMWCTFLTDIIK